MNLEVNMVTIDTLLCVLLTFVISCTCSSITSQHTNPIEMDAAIIKSSGFDGLSRKYGVSDFKKRLVHQNGTAGESITYIYWLEDKEKGYYVSLSPYDNGRKIELRSNPEWYAEKNGIKVEDLGRILSRLWRENNGQSADFVPIREQSDTWPELKPAKAYYFKFKGISVEFCTRRGFKESEDKAELVNQVVIRGSIGEYNREKHD